MASDAKTSGLTPVSMVRRLSDELANLTLVGVPCVDVRKCGEELLVQVELPGVCAEDVRLRLENAALVIDGERRCEICDRCGAAERSLVQFRREIPLPVEVDPATARATFDNGVLEVTAGVLPHNVGFSSTADRAISQR